MPRRITVTNAIAMVRESADIENDDHISDDNIKRILSRVYSADVYQVVAETGLRYFESSTTITADGSASYPEPSNHLSTVAFSSIDSAGKLCPLHEIMPQEAYRWRGLQGYGEAAAFELIDDRIYLYPSPSSGRQFLWQYIPQSPDLYQYAGNQIIDVVTGDGEIALVYGAAAECLAKSEMSNDFQLVKAAAGKEALQQWAALRNLSEPRRAYNPMSDDGSYLPGDWRR